MSESVHLIERAVRTIKSCYTLEHLICAKHYCDLVVRRYRKLYKGDHIINCATQHFKSIDLALELKELRKQQLEFIK